MVYDRYAARFERGLALVDAPFRAALRDFEAHANRYDSYGDELSAALRRAGASPAAAPELASADAGREGTGRRGWRR